MIINTKQMNELKRKIKELLITESVVKDMFDAIAITGIMTLGHLAELRKIINDPDLFKEEMESLTKDEILKNPYLRDIQIPNITLNQIALNQNRIIKKGTIVPFREKIRDLDSFEQKVSYFTCSEDLHFPAIIEGDTKVCWMTVEPIEINSFHSFVQNAKGNILLLGCGLGYVAYMLSLKREVKHITIVELNPDILTVFSQHILPQFRFKNKISLIQADAMEYLHVQNLTEFDHINVDIWRDTVDMIGNYVQCLEIEARYPNVHFSYWLEQELKEVIQKNLLEEIAGMEHQFAIFESIAKYILEQETITNKEDIKRVLSLNNFRQILLAWVQENKHRLFDYKSECDTTMEECLKLNKRNPDMKKEPL